MNEGILERYGDYHQQILQQKQRIRDIVVEKYDFAQTLLRAPRMSDMPRMKLDASDPVCSVVVKMMETFDGRILVAQLHLQQLYQEFDSMERRIRAAGLSEMEWRFVRLRYCECMQMREVGRRLGYSERQCRRFAARVERVLTGNERCGQDANEGSVE